MNLAQLAIKRPVFIVMIVLSIITLGLVGYSNLAWDLMPDVEFPTVTVSVAYPGASAEEMETLVAKPLEDSFSTLEGIDKVTSSCMEGVATISVAFKIGVDVKFSEIKVRDKVALVKPNLPTDIQEPIISRFSFSDIPIEYMSISGQRDSADLRDYLENEIQPKIEQVPGVASIQIFGGRKRVVKITVDKAMLLAKGLTVDQIKNAVTMRNLNYPVGVIEGPEKNITVRILGEFKDVSEVGELPLTTSTGKIVRIKDVALVEFTLEDETARVRVNKQSAVMFAVYKQSGANSVKVADDVIAEVKELSKTIPSDIVVSTAGDITSGIKRSVEGVLENIIIGAILAIMIVWLFLGNFRSAMITAVALPNSIIGAFFLVWIAGFSINTITLLSLSLAVGLLIDDSIVVRENIFRHIELGMTPMEAAEFGTNEVGLAVISTTLSIMAVFIPISFLSGMVGQFFKQFGLTVAFALAISLLDAFTTAPMLSAYWYKEDKGEKKGLNKLVYDMSKKWNEFYNELNDVYKDVLLWSLKNKKKVVFGTGLIFVLSMFLVNFVGKSFADNDQGIFIVNIETYTGAPLEKTDGYMKLLEEFIAKQKDIDSYFSVAGGNFTSTGGSITNTGFIFVSMKELSKRHMTTNEMQEKIRQYVKTQRLDRFMNVTISSQMGGGDESYQPVLVNLTGDDLKVLQSLGNQIKKIVQETPGAVDADISLKPGTPEIILKVDPIKSEKLGVSTAEIGEIVRTLIQGTKITTYKKAEKEYDLNIQLDKKNRRSPDDLKNITITTRSGKKIPLSAVVDFVYGSGPAEIRRENKIRIVKITANVGPGANVGEVNKKIMEKINKEVKLPSGYLMSSGGQSKEFASLGLEMAKAMLLAILFMYMILASLYNSFTQPLVLMLSVPLAIIGAFLALLITGYNLNLFAFIGLLMVLGVVAKNGILLLDFTNKMRTEGMSIRDALIHAAPIRLRPILMTTFAMIFGMLPIAMSLGEGSKGRESLATVVIGGLLTSTFLTLVIVPIAYEWVENKLLLRAQKKAVVKK
jgi:HAE1 family hydrophobic/amphiphilic exporter-1